MLNRCCRPSALLASLLLRCFLVGGCSGQTLTTDRVAYTVGDPILIKWDYSNAKGKDWIGLYPASSFSGGTVPSGSTMWVYLKSKRQSAVSGISLQGNVTFDAGNPVETGRDSWPLDAGTYQVHILREVAAPYPVVVSSSVFTVSPPTTAPSTAPTDVASPAGLGLGLSKTSFALGEEIVVAFSYPGNPNNEAWMSLWPANKDSQSLPSPSPYWKYICSDTQTASVCSSPYPETGSTTFDTESEGSGTVPLACGTTWKAYLIESSDSSSTYQAIAESTAFSISCDSPTGAPSPSVPSGPTLRVDKMNYMVGEDIVINFDYPSNPGTGAWISLWQADKDPSSLPSPSPFWNYVCSDSQSEASCTNNSPKSGSIVINSDAEGSLNWPLVCGTWRAYLIASSAYSSFYTSVAESEAFVVGDTTVCESNCPSPEAVEISKANLHIPPQDGLQVDRVAFASCFKPAQQSSNALWKHFRDNFATRSVFNWLGDNIYADTNDMEQKRIAYNAARDDPFYAAFGPVAEPKVPTSGTWDGTSSPNMAIVQRSCCAPPISRILINFPSADHDFAWNNYGDNYDCPQSSQNEFVYHFGIPESDPRHPAQGANQQAGIYSSYMFQTPTGDNGIHLINLDARSHRSPTFAKYGSCKGAASTMLGPEQWTWLEGELLSRTSKIKIIGSGTQVLPPINRDRSLSEYCAYDGADGTFDQAALDVGEDASFEGTSYESWAEIPQDRTRLLRLAQQSINAGLAERIIFLSGDQHWAEIMAKEIPARDGQAAVTVFEVTASGIDQNWPYDVPNTLRVRPNQNYEGVVSMTYSNENTCSGDEFHVCNAQANYGGIEVDWDNSEVHLTVYTPHGKSDVASRVTLSIAILYV